MEIAPQAVFAKLQARIAQLELDKAVTEVALEEAQAQLTTLEIEHAQCSQKAPPTKAVQNGHGTVPAKAET